MQVFKFGGASVKDSNCVRNLLNIVKKFTDEIIIVLSAFGKTTNALEEILKLSFSEEDACLHKLTDLEDYHIVQFNS